MDGQSGREESEIWHIKDSATNRGPDTYYKGPLITHSNRKKKATCHTPLEIPSPNSPQEGWDGARSSHGGILRMGGGDRPKASRNRGLLTTSWGKYNITVQPGTLRAAQDRPKRFDTRI